MIRAAVQGEFSFDAARSKVAEVLEKVLKAELIRLGWALEKTHDHASRARGERTCTFVADVCG